MQGRDILSPGIRNEYEKILQKFDDESRREQFDNFVNYVETETEFLVAPASTKFHMSQPNGLLLHSLSVASIMFDLKEALNITDVSDSSIVVTGLFHDLGKVGDPEIHEPLYIVCEPTERQKQFGFEASQPYKYNDKADLQAFLIHADASAYLVTKHFPCITRQEYQAIKIHDGMIKPGNQEYALKECKLQWLLHSADVYSAKFLE